MSPTMSPTMPPAPSGRQPLTWADMERALTTLDAEIAKSDLLMSVAPLRLISVGGSLAVRVCFNREASYDIDCLLDPNVAAAADYAEEFKAVVSTVAHKGGFAMDWLNQQVELFVARSRRVGLFLESVQQGVIVYNGVNVVIYAGRLDWALERKMRRVAHARSRRGVKDVDVPDAAALVRLMRAPSDEAIVEVAEYYAQAYGEVGIADMVRDAETGRWKYKGIDKEWVWC